MRAQPQYDVRRTKSDIQGMKRLELRREGQVLCTWYVRDEADVQRQIRKIRERDGQALFHFSKYDE